MKNPSQRGGADSDMAASILFLVSPAGLFYNNQLLHPDGGNILVRQRRPSKSSSESHADLNLGPTCCHLITGSWAKICALFRV